MKKYDVAIVGSGPSGATFARELVRTQPSLKVILIDGQDEDNKKVCGGLLAPDAQREFASLGLTLPKCVLADPQIFSVETIDLCKGIVRCYQRHYLNMDRFAFDKWLVSLIPDSVEVFNGRCTGVIPSDDKYEIRLRSRSEESIVESKYIVGADGANSFIRRQFFGRIPVQYVSIQQYFKYESQSLPPYSCVFDQKTSDSCSWTIKKDGCFIFGGAFAKKGCRKSFEEQKKRLETFIGSEFGEPLKTEACLLTSPRRYRDFITGKDNVFLIGEAAGFISASSFEGISSAMISGKLLADAFSEKDVSAVQKHYSESTRRLKLKLWIKMQKRRILCSPLLRWLIMKSGIESVK